MQFGAATHPGYVRPDNEDGYFIAGEHAVMAVADGMGGHDHGEVAAHLALAEIEGRAATIAAAGPAELPSYLHETVQAANTTILTQAESQDARLRMGTTLVLAALCGDRLYFAHIGDSRLYLLRGEMFTQLTRDHSLVQSMVDRGEISAEEAAIHPLRHQITRVVGGEEYVSPEIASQTLEPGDMLLLCSDGLSGVATGETIKGILQARRDPQACADALVQAALDAGAPDNVTAVVAVYQQPRPLPTTPSPEVRRPRRAPWWQLLLLGVLLLGVLVLAYAYWGYYHPRYYLAENADGALAMYMNRPLLPMLARTAIPLPDAPVVLVTDAAPYLLPYLDKSAVPTDREVSTDGGNIPARVQALMPQGITVKSFDEGVELERKLARETAARLLRDAKQALDANNLIAARTLITRAYATQGDPEQVQQLQMLLRQKAVAETAPTIPRP